MRVFISWSQKASERIAKILKEALTTFFNEKIDFWVSAEDINSGSISANEIITALQGSDMIIICLDSGNYTKPWIYFETGVIFGRKYNSKLTGKTSIVYPIIFDELTFKDFSNTPFKDLQLMRFNEQSFRDMLLKINNYYKQLTRKELLGQGIFDILFNTTWNNIHNSVNSIIEQNINGAETVLNSDNVVEILKKYDGFPEAKFGNAIQYEKGFETQTFYKFLLDNVKERLFIFGRKNRKIVENDLKESFGRILDNNVDLRMLYIHPDAEESINNDAQDVDDFREKLITSLKYAIERFSGLGRNIEEYCRLYKTKRDSEIIIADNVVFFKDLEYSEKGKLLHFTNASFFIVSVNSQIGSNYFSRFTDVWDAAEKATEEIIKTMK